MQNRVNKHCPLYLLVRNNVLLVYGSEIVPMQILDPVLILATENALWVFGVDVQLEQIYYQPTCLERMPPFVSVVVEQFQVC